MTLAHDTEAAMAAAFRIVARSGRAGASRAELCAAVGLAEDTSTAKRVVSRLRRMGHDIETFRTGNQGYASTHRYRLAPMRPPPLSLPRRCAYRPLAADLGIAAIVRNGVSLARVPSVDGRA